MPNVHSHNQDFFLISRGVGDQKYSPLLDGNAKAVKQRYVDFFVNELKPVEDISFKENGKYVYNSPYAFYVFLFMNYIK